jgi:hypothetical protein
MKLQDLHQKYALLSEALAGTRTKVDIINIDLDKESFKALHKEAGEPTMYEPNNGMHEYWFSIKIKDLYIYINFKPKAITTYETL